MAADQHNDGAGFNCCGVDIAGAERLRRCSGSWSDYAAHVGSEPQPTPTLSSLIIELISRGQRSRLMSRLGLLHSAGGQKIAAAQAAKHQDWSASSVR